jgi:hypothetical protein
MIAMNAVMFVLGSVAVALLVAGYLYSLRFIIQYAVTSQALQIRVLGRITVRRIGLSDIREVRILHWWPPSMAVILETIAAETWPSQIFTKRGVLVRRKTGLSRRLVLSPKDPENFIKVLTREIRLANRNV